MYFPRLNSAQLIDVSWFSASTLGDPHGDGYLTSVVYFQYYSIHTTVHFTEVTRLFDFDAIPPMLCTTDI